MTNDSKEYERVTQRIGNLNTITIWTITQSLWKLKKSMENLFTLEAKLSRSIIEGSGKERERQGIYYWEVKTVTVILLLAV